MGVKVYNVLSKNIAVLKTFGKKCLWCTKTLTKLVSGSTQPVVLPLDLPEEAVKILTYLEENSLMEASS